MNKDDLMPLTSDLQSLLLDEQAAPAMPSALQAKIGARLASSIADLPAGADAGAEAGADAGTAEEIVAESAASAEVATSMSPLASLAAKPILLAATTFGLGLGAGVVGTTYYGSQDKAPLVQPAPVVEPVLVQPAAEDASPAELPAPLPVIVMDASPIADTADTRPKKSIVKTPSRDKDLAAERSLLELSRTAITRGDAPTALKQLQKHARLYRSGRLAEERDALWVQALALHREFTKAKSKADAFKKKYPKSLFLPVVDHVLKEAP